MAQTEQAGIARANKTLIDVLQIVKKLIAAQQRDHAMLQAIAEAVAQLQLDAAAEQPLSE